MNWRTRSPCDNIAVKILKSGTSQTHTVNLLKLNIFVYKAVMGPNDADGMANSVDPDQTAQ